MKWDDTIAECCLNLREILLRVVRLGAFAEAERRGRGRRIFAFSDHGDVNIDCGQEQEFKNTEKDENKEAEIESMQKQLADAS